jgi:hypothetical protein
MSHAAEYAALAASTPRWPGSLSSGSSSRTTPLAHVGEVTVRAFDGDRFRDHDALVFLLAKDRRCNIERPESGRSTHRRCSLIRASMTSARRRLRPSRQRAPCRAGPPFHRCSRVAPASSANTFFRPIEPSR